MTGPTRRPCAAWLARPGGASLNSAPALLARLDAGGAPLATARVTLRDAGGEGEGVGEGDGVGEGGGREAPPRRVRRRDASWRWPCGEKWSEALVAVWRG